MKNIINETLLNNIKTKEEFEFFCLAAIPIIIELCIGFSGILGTFESSDILSKEFKKILKENLDIDNKISMKETLKEINDYFNEYFKKIGTYSTQLDKILSMMNAYRNKQNDKGKTDKNIQ